MTTELVQLFPRLRDLARSEKLYVLQFLISELAQDEEASLLQSNVAYPIWSPYEAHGTADVMLQALEQARGNDHA